MLHVSILLCLVSNVTCVLCRMLHVSIFLCLVSIRKIDIGNIEHKTQKDRYGEHWTQDTERQIRVTLESNATRVYLSVSCFHCYPCLSFCVLCPMVHVSIFLCLVPNGTRVSLSVSCVQCYTCLSVCVLCPKLPVSIDTGNIRHKTQKDKHGNIGHKTQKDRHM
jgi:Fe-S-cluster-containing hydrogenase component 2